MTKGADAAVWLLSVGQTLTYAGVYYAFPALLPDLRAATGWSVAQLALGPTVAFLIMAVLTPFTGRLVDRGFGGEMLAYAPILAAAGVAGLAYAPTPMAWLLAWAAIGIAQAGCLYETCFAFVTRRLGAGARGAITRVTLVAGLAGTLAFPLGDVLGRVMGGQQALLAFAALILFGAVPVNALAVRQLRRGQRLGSARPQAEPGALRDALRRPMFWAVSAMFGLIMLNHGILLTYVLVLFEDRGASAATATIAAACIGPAQVLGRLALLFGGTRIDNRQSTLWSFGAVVAAAVVLMAAGAAPGLVFAVAALQGAGAGLLSILRPVLVADKLGHRGFGTISGAVAVAPILSAAAAPSVGAALLLMGGPGMIYGSCLVMAAAALAIAVWVVR